MNKNTIEEPEQLQPDDIPRWWVRFGWLIIIWSLSVSALGVVAFAIKKLMVAAGMST